MAETREGTSTRKRTRARSHKHAKAHSREKAPWICYIFLNSFQRDSPASLNSTGLM